MAIYHLSVKVISRANGSSALTSAAYRSASRLHDQRLDRDHDFTNKFGVVHSEVMLPGNALDAWRDRERLWKDVEAVELRKDAQLSREVEFAIPREMNVEQGIALTRDFVQTEFVDRGMCADLNLHWDIGADGVAKPHAHVMLTMRDVNEDGFGAKVRDWNSSEFVCKWRNRLHPVQTARSAQARARNDPLVAFKRLNFILEEFRCVPSVHDDPIKFLHVYSAALVDRETCIKNLQWPIKRQTQRFLCSVPPQIVNTGQLIDERKFDYPARQ